MTKTFKLMTVSAAALIAGAAHAQAVPQTVIDAVAADLTAQGFTRIEIDVERRGLDVDAYGPNLEGDFYYSHAGELLDADIEQGGSYQEFAYLDEDDWEDDDDDDWSSYDDDEDEEDDYDSEDEDDYDEDEGGDDDDEDGDHDDD